MRERSANFEPPERPDASWPSTTNSSCNVVFTSWAQTYPSARRLTFWQSILSYLRVLFA